MLKIKTFAKVIRSGYQKCNQVGLIIGRRKIGKVQEYMLDFYDGSLPAVYDHSDLRSIKKAKLSKRTDGSHFIPY